MLLYACYVFGFLILSCLLYSFFFRLSPLQGVIRASNFAGSLYAETTDAAALEMEAAMALAASEAAR